MSPGGRAGPVTGTNFASSGFIWLEISALFPRWEKAKYPGEEFWREMRKRKQTWPNTKILTFAPIIALENFYSCVTTVKWDAYDVENTAGNARGCNLVHQSSSPRLSIYVTGLKCSYGKIFSPLSEIPDGKTEIQGTEPAHPLIWTQKILQRPSTRNDTL